jgi:TolA-binding protein
MLLHETLHEARDGAGQRQAPQQVGDVDPREWSRRDDMTVMVGLGSGGKSEQMAHLSMIANAQEKIMMAPPLQGLVKPANVYNLVKRMAEVSGYKNAEEFFTPVDPNAPPPAPPPDPKIQIAQMQAQQEQQAMQMQAQLDQQKAERDAQLQVVQMQRQAQVEQAQAQADIETQRAKATTEMQLAQQRFELDRQLKVMDFALKAHAASQPTTDAQGNTVPGAPPVDMEKLMGHFGPPQNQHHEVMAAIHGLHQAVKGGKRVVRGPDNRAVGVAGHDGQMTHRFVRDQNGHIAGTEPVS